LKSSKCNPNHAQVIGAPEPDELCREKGYAVPDYVSSYQRPSVL